MRLVAQATDAQPHRQPPSRLVQAREGFDNLPDTGPGCWDHSEANRFAQLLRRPFPSFPKVETDHGFLEPIPDEDQHTH